MITGLLLAAGRGRRLGGAKQLVPWPVENGQTKPLVAASFDAISPVCDKMIVVVGHKKESVIAALSAREFLAIEADPDAQMADSILAGLRVATTDSRVLLQPADHPTVLLSTLQAIIAASDRTPEKAIIPTRDTRGGHPIMIPPIVVSDLVVSSLESGLNSFWQKYPERSHHLGVSDPGIVSGINTPQELREAVKRQRAT